MGDTMRVLMVTTSYPRHVGDHAGHFVAALAEHLTGLGNQVTALAPHEGALPLSEDMGGVRVERFAYLPGAAERVAYGSGVVENLRRIPLAVVGLPFFALALRRATRRLAADADIVHVHWGPTAALAAPWRLGTPYVLTLHGSDVTLARRGGLWHRLLRTALRHAAGVNVVAEEQREYLLHSGLWGERRPLVVIPSGIDEELIERERPARGGRPFEFVFVGRLLATKGAPELLQAFSELRARGADVHLRFVGTGPLETELRERAVSAGVGDRITMSGAVEHAGALAAIAAADALVLPSHGEGSPLVVAEALALGTPVIGTRVGAIPDLLGADGLVVEPGDPAGLSQAMERLVSDPALCERLSSQGRERARERLSWGVIAHDTAEFYRSALEHAPTPPPARLPVTRVLRAALLLALLFFITRALVTLISQADFGSITIDPPMLVGSIALLGLYYAMFTGGLVLLFRANGSPARYRDVFKVSFMANLGKYLPGGIWPVAARMAMASKIQMSRHGAALLAVVESGVSVAGACAVIVAAGLSGLAVPGMPGWAYWTAALALAGFFVVMHPRVLGAAASLLPGVGRRATEPLRMGYASTVGLVGYYALTWMVAGAAFWTLTASLVGDPGAGWLAYSAYYAFGAVVGLLVLFAPGGIGAREGALLLVLSGPLGAPMAAVVSVAARLWSTVTELVMSAVAVAIPYAASSAEVAPIDETDS